MALAPCYPKTFLLTASAAGRTKGINVMNATKLDQIDQEILSYEVSDEALETAASVGKDKAGNVTIAYCSGLDTCPA